MVWSRLFFAVLAAFAAQSMSVRADCFDCQFYPNSSFIAPFRDLSSDWYSVSQATLFPRLPNKLWLKTDEIEQSQELSVLQNQIQSFPSCDSKDLFRPKIQFQWLAMNLPYDSPYLSPGIFYGDGRAGRRIEPVGNWMYNKNKRDWMKTASFQQFSTVYQPKYSMKIEYAMGKTLSQDSWEDALGVFQQLKTELNESEQLEFMQRLGAAFYFSYDRERNDSSSPRSKGVVHSSDIFKTLLSRQAIFERTDDAGVCRDIASAQAEVAAAFGYKNVYVIGYKAKELVGHASVYFESENGKSYRINREALQTQGGLSGGMALMQLDPKSPDLSIRYYVADSQGRPKTSVVSHDQSQRVLALMGGSTVQSISPGYVARGNLGAADIHFSPNWNGRIFLGTNGFGQQMMGMGLVYNQEQYQEKKSGFSNQVGLSLNQTAHPDAPSIDLFGFYEGAIRSKEITLDPQFKIKAQAYAEGTAQLLYQANEQVNFLSAIGDLNIRAGVRFQQGDESSKVRSEVDVSSSWIPALGDFRDQRSVRPFLDHVAIRGKVDLKLNSDRAYLYGLATAVIDSYGGVGIAEVGYRDESFRAYMNARGRIDPNSPLFRESAAREWTIGLEKQWNQGQDRLQLEYSRPESLLGVAPQLRLRGQYTLPVFGK